MRRRFLALMLTCFLTPVLSAPTDDLDPLPPWNYDELVQSATNGIAKDELASVRLLAWHTQEDGRPLRYDAALLWLHSKSASGSEKWLLVVMARHPLAAKPEDRWVHSYQGHEWQPVAGFDSPPNNKDVYKFIEGHWDFEPDSRAQKATRLINGGWHPVEYSGFRILAGAVRARTWKSAIGESPVRFHRGELANKR